MAFCECKCGCSRRYRGGEVSSGLCPLCRDKVMNGHTYDHGVQDDDDPYYDEALYEYQEEYEGQFGFS